MNTNKYKLLKLTWMVKKAHQECLNKTSIDYGLSPSEGMILLFLFKHDLDTAQEIAEYRSISKSLVSKSINHLIDRGLVEVRIDSEDKRINRLDLTEKADEIIEKLNQNEVNFYTQIEKGLSNQDKETLDTVVSTLYENVSEILD